MSNVRKASEIEAGTVILRRAYGAWRELRITDVEVFTEGFTGTRYVLWAEGMNGGGKFPLPPMGAEDLVKVSSENHS